MSDDVLRLLDKRPEGMTDSELAAALQKRHQHINQTRNHLAQRHLIVRDLSRRPIVNRLERPGASPWSPREERPRPTAPGQTGGPSATPRHPSDLQPTWFDTGGVEVANLPAPSPGDDLLALGGHGFRQASVIDCDRDNHGNPLSYTAHERFPNPRGLKLNAYGRGPFVRLRTSRLPATSGVYAVIRGHEVTYIGIAQDIAQRWGRRGYAVIDPRNCYVGGQSTNCHVNNLISHELASGHPLTLWILEHPDPRPVESRLIRQYRPSWNIQGA